MSTNQMNNLTIVKNYGVINEILEKNDPIGILEYHNEKEEKEEEYSVVAVDIANRANLLEMGELKALIRDSFEFWFGDDCISYSQISKIAEEIYALFQ